MKLEIEDINTSLNKAFLTQSPFVAEIDKFKENSKILLSSIKPTDNKETIKAYINDFLKNTYYQGKFATKVNVNNIDLVILNGKNVDDKIGIIVETKAIRSTEMITTNDLNKKSFQELIQYYLEERTINENLEIKHLIITNSIDWFIFNANEFERIFYQNKSFLNKYNEWYNQKLVSKNKDWFYSEIAKAFIENEQDNIVCTYFNLQSFQNFESLTEQQVVAFYKIFSPEHLLKLPFQNDRNSLNREFYNELLHIIGLTETKDNTKKIQRLNEKERNEGSLLENTINIIQSDDILSTIENPDNLGDTEEEQLFSIGLELCITWINRILFLKLLESQLLNYNQNNQEYAFLNANKIRDFEELLELFFEVLAVKTSERKTSIQKKYEHIPYLNSSLFEQSLLEKEFIKINQLKQNLKLQIYSSTVLKDENGKRISGEKFTLQYLFEFLDSFNFASDNKVKVQETNKTIINSAVLGLIFEKINGYKEGSFYTPGFITMYMCNETLRKSIIQKFNSEFNWNCQSMNQLYNQIGNIDLGQANKTFNSIRICDPAVGSGHFLVSALNELIAIKSELGILCDNSNRKLRNTYCEVQNDELFITTEGELFHYNKKDKEKQRIQETIFNEKRILIENCLFGVDINTKSVQICRLRLWIELLKSAYYKVELLHAKDLPELETLPNIDINIKHGNSLISRFTLNGEGYSNGTVQKIQQVTQKYKDEVVIYKGTTEKKTKQQTIKKIAELKEIFASIVNPNDKDYIDLKKKESEMGFAPMTFSQEDKIQWNLKVDCLTKEISELKTKYDEKLKTVYGYSFDWRFEFPEILDENGKFIGFDVIIGNPPYFSVSKLEKSVQQYFVQSGFSKFTPSTDIYCLFFELSIKLLKQGGIISFITSNQWLQTEYGIKLKEFLLKRTNPLQLINFVGIKIFEQATVDTSILIAENSTNTNKLEVCHFNNDFSKEISIEKYFEKNKLIMTNLKQEKWYFEGATERELRNKIINAGKPIKSWNVEINRGIVTGFNEAFIIDEQMKNEIIQKEKKSEKIIKPVLRGRDLRKYRYNFANLYLINTHNGLKKKGIKPINVKENFPTIYDHFLKYEAQLKEHEDQGDGWSNLRNCTYFMEFEKPKLIYSETTGRRGEFSIDTKGLFLDKTCFMITGENLYWLNANLSSRLMEWFIEKEARLIGKQAIQYSKRFMDEVPIPEMNLKIEATMKDLIDKIMSENIKEKQKQEFMNKLDLIVYKLYKLTSEEIKIIESE